MKEALGCQIKAMDYGWLLTEGSSVFLLSPLTKAKILLPEFLLKIGSAYISFDPVSDDCLIVRIVKLRNADNSPVFHVLKVNFDQSGLRWTHVKDIGGAELLGSYNRCTCVRARDRPLLKRNHVCIVGDDPFGYLNMPEIFRDIMVSWFERLKNKSLSAQELTDSFWFLPSLSKGN
ncbi:uncharacterized protein A4U43_C04F2310 [Asparagus officinalis]|uniref:KIB1-4 beta-propeller domain-containing protein n=1 Tax=Asparagus officinalis TaxID=4686 RepID=A0A5P1EYB7_ASPOF|nr:uncharacterized protein A4U43_C04F2310 [Asparagus officinalis]